MDAQLHIYKYSTRLTKLVSIPAVHSTYYAGTGYFVSLGAHMGCWTITKFFLKNGKLMKKVLREGTLTDDDEDYPVPREYPIYEFDFDDLGPIYNM